MISVGLSILLSTSCLRCSDLGFLEPKVLVPLKYFFMISEITPWPCAVRHSAVCASRRTTCLAGGQRLTRFGLTSDSVGVELLMKTIEYTAHCIIS